jgi:hypothetical protein
LTRNAVHRFKLAIDGIPFAVMRPPSLQSSIERPGCTHGPGTFSGIAMPGTFPDLERRLRRWSDHTQPGSLAFRLRRSRLKAFATLLSRLPRPVRILDIGGEESFWLAFGNGSLESLDVTLLDLVLPEGDPRFCRIRADARDLSRFADHGFDVVYSNSVIEHLGGLEDQGRMAAEVERVGRRYFLQTPSRWFPVEPHFLFPFFQFLPRSLQVWVASHYGGGWYCHPGDPAAARREIEAIRLLTRAECCGLFPRAEIRTERFLGLAKSYLILGGWQE